MSNSILSIIELSLLIHNITFIIIFIILLVLILIFKNKFNSKLLLENQYLEFVWTAIPIIIIIFFIKKSIYVLYLNNEIKLSNLTIKIFGNQWFWNYELLNNKNSINSYIINFSCFNLNYLETDNSIFLPRNFQVLLIISSLDVIHSWTLPSINLKLDALPSQLNSSVIKINKMGILYGQCSEVCGVNHSFMPIKLESIKIKNFINLIK